MRIGVLGPLEIDEVGARLGTRDRVVLSALAMSPGQLLSPEQLADAVWGDNPPPTWTKSIQGCISRLRKILGPEAIETSAHGYRLRVPSDAVDVVEFDRAARRAEELLALREYEHARYVASRALELWRGRPLSELEGWEAGCAEAGRLTELRWELEEVVVEASLAAGHHREVLAQATRMVEAAPLRERRWALLARAQYQAGQQTEALRSLHRIRTILRQELGLDPSPDLVALEQAILRQDPGLLVADAPAGRDDASPYPGLRAYAEADAESFFGRDAEVRTCAERLRTVNLLAVVGPSGSGKSSLLRAGLVPLLRADGHEVVVLTPGAHPEEPMTAARPRAGSIILVDQAEEAFSLCLDEEERLWFFDALVSHTEHGRIVLAMRADFTGELASHPALAGLVEGGLFLLGAMSRDGLRAAIEGPARQRGLLLEPGLADLLVREVEGEPGALPLMSHALRETWLRHEGRTLTVAGYQASGGIRGAVAQSAEELYGQVVEADRRQLRELVLRLVVPGPEGEPVRSRVPRQQAVLNPAQAHLVERMVSARLVTIDQGDLELAHEALVRAWPRLQGWLDDDVEGQRLRHRLTQAAGDWIGLGRHESELYRGARLAAVTEWVTASSPQLSAVEEEFLDSSSVLAASEEESAREQVRRQRAVNRRLRVLAGGLALLMVVALVTGFLALRQTRAANRASLAADARSVGTAALTEQNPRQSLMMAVAAARMDPSVATDAALHEALATRPQLIRTTDLTTNSPLSWSLATPDGLLVTDRRHGLQLLSRDTLAIRATGQGGETHGDMEDVALTYSRYADVLAVASTVPDPRPVWLMDSRTLQPEAHQLGGVRGPLTVTSLSTSGNGRFLAAEVVRDRLVGSRAVYGRSGDVVVWDLRTRRVVRRIPNPKNFESGVALDRTGRHVFVSNPMRAYDVGTGRSSWHEPGAYSFALAVQPHGGLVADVSPSDYSVVQLRDPRTGHVIRTLQGHQDTIDWIAFSHDGRQVAASARDGLALVWDARDGELVHQIDVGGQQVVGVSFSPDDRTLFTVAEPSHQVSAWDLSGEQTQLTRIPIKRPVSIQMGNIKFSHDGTRYVTENDVGTPLRFVAHIVDLAHDTTTRAQTMHPDSAGAASWSPDDSRVAFGVHGVVDVVDGHTGKELIRRPVLPGEIINELSWSGDGRFLLATDASGDVIRLDPRTLDPAGPKVRLPERTYAVTSSPDGRYGFVIAGGTLQKWSPAWQVPYNHFYLVDFNTGTIVKRGSAGVANASYCDFSPDGRYVAVSGQDGQLAVIDLDTGQPVQPAVSAYAGNTLAVHYNSDGSLVTAASTTGQLALLDGRTGQLLATASLPPPTIATMSGFAPDGTVVVADFRGRVYRWDPSIARALHYACSITGRGLDPTEWALLFPNQPWRQTCPT